MGKSKSKVLSNIETINYENLERLVKDQKELTYSQLCKELEIPYLTSNSKKKQLNELAVICDFEKNGTKFKFLSLCSREELTLFNNRSVYLPYIELIIVNKLRLLSNEKPPVVYTTYNNLLKSCNMINENYKNLLGTEMYKKSLLMAEKFDFNYLSFYEYLDKSYNSVLRPIIANALISLSKKKRIDLNKGYRVYETVKYDDNVLIKKKDVSAIDPLGVALFEIEGEAFKRLNIKDESELYGSKRYLKDKYYELCQSILRERCEKNPTFLKNKWNYTRFIHCLIITINSDLINYDMSNIEQELNNKIQNKLLFTKTLDFLPNTERKQYIEATISKDGNDKYNFNPKEIKNENHRNQ